MPTYAYRCDNCDHALEVFQSMADAPKKKCPGCGRMQLKRQIGAGAGILFKGSGFYQTDYRSESYRSGAEAEKKAQSGEGKKSDSKKADAKPSGGDKKA